MFAIMAIMPLMALQRPSAQSKSLRPRLVLQRIASAGHYRKESSKSSKVILAGEYVITVKTNRYCLSAWRLSGIANCFRQAPGEG